MLFCWFLLYCAREWADLGSCATRSTGLVGSTLPSLNCFCSAVEPQQEVLVVWLCQAVSPLPVTVDVLLLFPSQYTPDRCWRVRHTMHDSFV
jgi:hypothetical protein